MAWTPPPQPTPFNTRPEDVLFLDVETVPFAEHFEELNDRSRDIFSKKMAREEGEIEQLWQERAALHSEFNKIACVSMGVFAPGVNGERTFRVKSFFGYNEKIILGDLAKKLGVAKFLVAHNGRRFDFPLLARKFVIHDLPIPSILNVTGVKPWESSLFDTMELWQFGDLKNFTSLDALCYCLGVDSPKGELNGSNLSGIYYGPSQQGAEEMPWEDKTLAPIARYCEGDVIALAQCFLRIINKPMIQRENIVVV